MSVKAIIFFIFLFISCKEDLPKKETNLVPEKKVQVQKYEEKIVKKYKAEILKKIPKDTSAYTQGLLFHNGFLYESTGIRGESSLRKINPETGQVLKIKNIPEKYFGEGISLFGNKLYYLTWTSRICYVFDIETFEEITTHTYYTEGWGLTNDSTVLFLSDGSHFIRHINPDTFEIINTVPITNNGAPVGYLNELEYINGKVWANVYGTNLLVEFDPYTGDLLSVADLTFLNQFIAEYPEAEVMNGIAYEAETGRLYVTGKNWPYYFDIRLISVQ